MIDINMQIAELLCRNLFAIQFLKQSNQDDLGRHLDRLGKQVWKVVPYGLILFCFITQNDTIKSNVFGRRMPSERATILPIFWEIIIHIYVTS